MDNEEIELKKIVQSGKQKKLIKIHLTSFFVLAFANIVFIMIGI